MGARSGTGTGGARADDRTRASARSCSALLCPLGYATAGSVRGCQVTDQAMRLVADSEVRVIATNAAGGAAETWSIWESSKLGTDYIVLEASLGSDVDGGDQIVVVGTAPDTVVRIRSVGSSPNPPVDVRITLGAGQTYQYANASSWNVNGWSVMGDKPIALFAGNSNTADVGVMGDAVNEQILRSSTGVVSISWRRPSADRRRRPSITSSRRRTTQRWSSPDPAADRDGRSPRAADDHRAWDGLECTGDMCDGAASCQRQVIDGVCAIESPSLAVGTPGAADPCMVCDPAKGPTQ